MNDQAIRALIADHLAVEVEQVSDHALFGPDLGADSLDLVQLTMLLEEQLGVSIDDDESERCLTVGEVLHLVRRKLPAPAADERAAA
jgi:acyl carrier protein